MKILAVILALVAAFVVFKFIAGVVKFGVIALIVIVALYFVAGGLR